MSLPFSSFPHVSVFLLALSAAILADRAAAQAPAETENAADNYLAAAVMFKGSAEGENDACTVIEKGWVGKHPDFEDHLFLNSDALAELREGFRKPHCSMPAVEGFDDPLPYMGSFRSMARLLLAEGRMFEGKGEYEKAYQDFTDVVKLGRDIPQNGVLIHYLVGIAIENMAFNVIRNSLKDPGAPAEVYAKAARRLEELEASEPALAEALRQESEGTRKAVEQAVFRAYARLVETVHPESACFPPLFLLQACTNVPKWFQKSGDLLALSGALGVPVIWVLYPPNVTTALANLKKYGDIAVRRAGMPYPEAVKIPLPIPDDLISKAIVPACERVQVLYAGRCVRASATRTMAALVAYKKVHGRFPESLDAVVSAAAPPRTDAPFSRMPLDAFSDRPLRYKPVGEGFVLYSIGPDMVDDRSERECPASLAAASKGDIVFRLNR